MQNRTIFLFGAGAAYSWGGPTTTELTDLVRKSGRKFITEKSGVLITEFIYQKLVESGYSESEANFETIINVIEELIVYYSEFNNEKNTPSLLACFLNSHFEEELLNFSIKGGERKHGYTLQIPKGVDYDYSAISYYRENPRQFFLQHLLQEVLTNISARISEYANHLSNKNIDISQLFINWIIKIRNKNILRLYTLNYDHIYKSLLEESSIEIFNGFSIVKGDGYMPPARTNVRRILEDTESNIYYNLHGSAYWNVIDMDRHQLPNPEIVYAHYLTLPINYSPASLQIERGKTLMITNIITGYQKAQKSTFTPFKQMHNSFDRDLCKCDTVYIIGYSFGDEHINESIKMALRHNPNANFIVIDPNFIKNNMDFKLSIKLFSFIENGILHPKKIQDNLYSYYDGKFQVYTLGFKEFLEL